MQPTILSLQQLDNLAVIQFSTKPFDTLEYISMENAMKTGSIEVTESSEQGSVNQLSVNNRSKFFIFMMDGDIIAGAKQNRVLNTSVFLAPHSTTKLPVSCVEQGRWRYKSLKFESTDYVAPAKLRKAKSETVTQNLKAHKSFLADQSEVWGLVEAYDTSFRVNSVSKNLSDVFDRQQPSNEKYLQTFSANKEATGIAIFINKELKGVDVFNRTDIFEEYFPKIIKGATLDLFNTKTPGQITIEEASAKTLDLLNRFHATRPELHDGVAAGQEKRFNTKELSGFELDYNGDLIHLSGHAI
jgi:hypothetical protein